MAYRQDQVESCVESRSPWPATDASPVYIADFPVRYIVNRDEKGWREARVKRLSMKWIQMEITRVRRTGADNVIEIVEKAEIPDGSMLLLQFRVPSRSVPETNLLLSGTVSRVTTRETGVCELLVELTPMEEEEKYLLVDLIAYLLFEGKARSMRSGETKLESQIV